MALSLVVGVGFEESQGAESLLAEFGYRIGRTPIGSAHAARVLIDSVNVFMHESWPVLRPEGRGEVWVECWDYPLVVFEKIGDGGLRRWRYLEGRRAVAGPFLRDAADDGESQIAQPWRQALLKLLRPGVRFGQAQGATEGISAAPEFVGFHRLDGGDGTLSQVGEPVGAVD